MFRVCYSWLIDNDVEVAKKNLSLIPEYGRWDDLIYIGLFSAIEKETISIIEKTLIDDMNHYINNEPVSLLGKWCPSENASNKTTKFMANHLREELKFSHRVYRKMLSALRERINIVEKLMSSNNWNAIEFDKLPSKAGLIYRNTFRRRKETKDRYNLFIQDNTKKVNAGTLYPYEITSKTQEKEKDREILDKYWKNLPDYFNGKSANMICVVDTSASMYGKPFDVATSLGIYCAERLNGPFKDTYISFSSHPNLMKIKGKDITEKVEYCRMNSICESTNLPAVFDLIRYIAINGKVKSEDIPETIVVISDMEIDVQTSNYYSNSNSCPQWKEDNITTEMEKIRKQYADCGLKMPRLVYWNVDARNDTILDKGDNVSFVSGFSPSIFESIITGKNGKELMLDKLNSERYYAITI